MQRTALYRHFDKIDRLLYVGISLNPFARTRQHQGHAAWFETVTHIEIQWFDSLADAIAAEARAIHRERPLHNITGNDKPRSQDPEFIMLDANHQVIGVSSPPAHGRKALAHMRKARMRSVSKDEQ